MIMEDSSFYIFTVLSGIIGLCVGSFLNVVVYRLPKGMSLAFPPSHCPRCGHGIKWYDNIPVLSYIILGGRCRFCRGRISFRYTVTEIACGALWTACALIFGREHLAYSLIAMLVCAVCICVFFIDLEHMVIYDRFQIILAAAAAAMVFLDPDYGWLSHLIGFAASSVLFIGVAAVMGRILKREALGGGDVKFAMSSGLMLGWQKFLLMLLAASLSASVYMIYKKKKNGESREIPFAPFLTAGLITALLAGNAVIEAYRGFLGF